MVSIPACHAGDPGSIPGFGETFFFPRVEGRGPKKTKKTDPRGNRTPNLRVWNPTRCHCAMESVVVEKPFSNKKEKTKSQAGLEPAISASGGQRLIH